VFFAVKLPASFVEKDGIIAITPWTSFAVIIAHLRELTFAE
jgi:hypothetical protein